MEFIRWNLYSLQTVHAGSRHPCGLRDIPDLPVSSGRGIQRSSIAVSNSPCYTRQWGTFIRARLHILDPWTSEWQLRKLHRGAGCVHLRSHIWPIREDADHQGHQDAHADLALVGSAGEYDQTYSAQLRGVLVGPTAPRLLRLQLGWDGHRLLLD